MISVYIYGLEYYMYGNREVAKKIDHVNKIQEHLSFFFTLSPFALIIQFLFLLYLIPNEILNVYTIVIILFANFCDYFNQEVYRYLVMLQNIRKANFLLIAKSGIFLLLVLLFYFFFNEIEIYNIVSLLLISYFILFIITYRYFSIYVMKFNKVKVKFLSIKELRNVVKFLMPFILLMIFSKGIEFFDKFAIEQFYGAKEVGIYSFLFSIASMIYIFVTSGFYIIYLPELIYIYENKAGDFRKKMFDYSKVVVIFSLLLVIGIVLGIEFLLNLIGKTELIENINLLYLLLGSYFLLNIATIPNLLLYVTKKDKELMLVSGIVFVINVVANFFLIKLYSIEGAAISLIISYSVNLLVTSYFGYKVWKKIE